VQKSKVLARSHVMLSGMLYCVYIIQFLERCDVAASARFSLAHLSSIWLWLLELSELFQRCEMVHLVHELS